MSEHEPLSETWTPRDLPVLREAARAVEEDETFTGVRLGVLSERTGLSLVQVTKAVKALEEDGLVEVRWVMGPGASRVESLSGAGRRAVGLWPTPESGLDRMITALQAIASNTAEDEDTRTRARKTLDALTGAGKHIGLAMATAYATGVVPGHS